MALSSGSDVFLGEALISYNTDMYRTSEQRNEWARLGLLLKQKGNLVKAMEAAVMY